MPHKEVSDDITVVLYHQAARIQKEIEAHYSDIQFHMQDAEQFPGTGGAMKGIKTKNERTLILNGDMPLITKDSLLALTSRKCRYQYVCDQTGQSSWIWTCNNRK